MSKNPNIENVTTIEYADVMKQSYIDYAMSVIVARALPDVRDGLKPVQRRILYDMYELGLRPDRPFKKCARVVGDTMGKYHPHGDSSIYEALVVMAQEFKKGMALVSGHGNFGSIEGDGAAAMRYTECRLQNISYEGLLRDLDKNIVDFIPNFDESLNEPEVLPALIPNILINGAEGIAVGMATNIPPHNVVESIEGLQYILKHPDATTEKLMKYIKGPDFPTGALIVNKSELPKIYETGTGKVKIRGKVEVEKRKDGKEQLVITEIPYTMIGNGINKLQNDIYDLVENKLTTDIVDISNQSSKDGIRIVLELKKGTDTENLINLLYKKTKLEDTFAVNMLAVNEGKPEIMNLKAILNAVADFQIDICTRKYRQLLEKEEEKKEVQEGLLKACDVIDVIIEALRGSKNVKQVRDCLLNGKTEGIKFKHESSKKIASKFAFTKIQADAILDMKLQKLIGLEIEALEKEHEETLKKISEYRDILENHDVMLTVIDKELNQLKKKYKRDRKTEIIEGKEVSFELPEMQERDIVVLIDRFSYVRSIEPQTYERNKQAADEESRFVVKCKNTEKLLLITDTGRLITIKNMELPFGKFRDKAVPIDTLSNFKGSKETIIFANSMEGINDSKIVFVTAEAMIKVVPGEELQLVSKKSATATKLSKGDSLAAVKKLEEYQDHIVLETDKEFFIHFKVEEIPELKKMAMGVRAMKLEKNDLVKNMYLFSGKDTKETYANEVLKNENYTLEMLDEAINSNEKLPDEVSSFHKAADDVIVIDDHEVELNKVKLTKRDSRGRKIKLK